MKMCVSLIIPIPPLFHNRSSFQNQQIRKELDDAQKAQTMLVERLISCCKEVRVLFFPILRASFLLARSS